MTILNVINTTLLTIGIPSIIGACIYVGRKLQILDSLNESSTIIKYNVIVISNFLIKTNKDFNSQELKTFSPSSLTQQGLDFVHNVNFDKTFRSNKHDFYNLIDLEKPRLKYNVESTAIKSIYLLADKPYMEALKIYLYNNPSRSIADAAPTLGVYVRDHYLEDHPEITQ